MAALSIVRFRHRGPAAACAILAAFCAASVAEAVIVSGTGVTDNTSAPDPVWWNVGTRGDGSGTYLGNGWVLTANHIGGGAITLNDGKTYQMEPGSGRQLVNPGNQSPTDLYLFKVTTDPGLPWLNVATATGTNDIVLMIGAGMTRGSEKYWSVDTNRLPWTWNEVVSGTYNAQGYTLLAQRSMGWGVNVVTSKGPVTVGTTPVDAAFGTTFSTGLFSPPYDGYEGQASTGDSGGGVFRMNGSRWELAGIMVGVTPPFSGQPASALFDYGHTYMADLPAYRDQIVAITAVPEPGALLLVAVGAGILGSRRFVRRR